MIPYVTRQLLRALDYIHSAGLRHGALTPHAIMISAQGHVRLGEFNYCQAVRESGVNTSAERIDHAYSMWYLAPGKMSII